MVGWWKNPLKRDPQNNRLQILMPTPMESVTVKFGI
jgi:hypothetical protein